ncbi:MAG: EamA family transporter [Myxococcales bacterium]
MRPRDVALALLVVLLWGVNFAVIKVGLRGVSPFVLAGLRMVLTAFPAILLVERPRLPIRVFAGFALASFLMQFGLLFLAIKVGMPSGLASVVQQSQVFFTVLLAAAVFGEHPRPMQLAGTIVAAAGLAIIGAQSGTSPSAAASGLRPSQAEPAPPPLAGFLLTLAAASFWAIGNLVSRSLSRYGRVSGLAFVVWSALIPPVPFFLLARIVEGPGTIAASFRAMDAGSWAAVGYLAFGATLGGYGLWNKLLKAYPAAQVARFTLLVPVIGLACGAAFFGESLSVAQLAGCALVALGLALPIAAMWLTRLA